MSDDDKKYPLVFSRRGDKLMFSVGHQSFTLDYEPEGDEDYEFMCEMLRLAISRVAPVAPDLALGEAVEPTYPQGDVLANCICGSWPGGACLKCPKVEPVSVPTNNGDKNG